MTRTIWLAASALAVLTACSGSTSKTTSSAPTTTPTSTTTSTPTSTSAACGAAGGSGGGSGSGDVLVPGDIPDNQAYVTYHSPTAGFRIDTPEGWAQSTTGSGVVFSDKFNAIHVEVTNAPSAPSTASAESSDVPAIASSAHCFQAGKVSEVARKAGPAVLITYVADSPPDAVTGKVVRQDVERYEFWQAGEKAAITLSSPVKSDNVDPWRKVTDSFAWGP